MFETLVDRLLDSPDGREVLQRLESVGLTPEQARRAITATAEGAAGPMGRFAGSARCASGVSTAVAAPAAVSRGCGLPGPAAVPGALVTLVSEKMGLEPAAAQAVVSIALPWLLEAFEWERVSSPGETSADATERSRRGPNVAASDT